MPSELIARSRLEALLAASRGKHVVVIGDAMLDVYLRGDADRISPEAPVPVVRVKDRRHALGGAANVAQNVVALGANATLVAAVGSDMAAGTIRNMLEAIGATPAGLVTVDRPTTTKTRVVARAQIIISAERIEWPHVLLADRRRPARVGMDAKAAAVTARAEAVDMQGDIAAVHPEFSPLQMSLRQCRSVELSGGTT